MPWAFALFWLIGSVFGLGLGAGLDSWIVFLPSALSLLAFLLGIQLHGIKIPRKGAVWE